MKIGLISMWLVACCWLTQASAQKVLWGVDFVSTVENREGGDALRPDQTLIFTRLAPEVGLTLDGGRNRVVGGAAWYQPLNDGLTGYKVLPTLYYQYRDTAGLTAALGWFPRSLMHERAPRYLWSDSLDYCTPNVRGALLHYSHHGRGWVQAVLDWRQMQTTTRREAFNVLVSGAMPLAGPLWAKGHIYYNHLAKRKDAPEGEGVIDDGTINPMLALRLSPGNVALNIETGAIVQLQRWRAQDGWHTPAAFVAQAQAHWRWLEVHETLSAGKNLFPLYSQFGPELNLGDPYYCSKFYSRTDVRAHLVNNSHVDVSVGLTFHATDRITGFWQQLSCRYHFNN
ncbi:MAG: hypothetical protein IJT30_01100 [Muribaculaceae bacterium]|nr:hypothetical protein [Muribaculaceae bacterium]